MSAKAIREATGKDILNRHLGNVAGAAPCKFASVTSETNWNELVQQNPWLETTVSIARPLASHFIMMIMFFPFAFSLSSIVSNSFLRRTRWRVQNAYVRSFIPSIAKACKKSLCAANRPAECVLLLPVQQLSQTRI